MLISYKRGQSGVVIRVKILNSSVGTGAGLTGLTSASSGLIISTIADNEATATAYTVTGSTIESITTLGTFAAPTATKCRFKEVDATNHKGIYEIQIADARYAVSGAKSLLVSISGATNAAETDVVIPLVDLDPYSTTQIPDAVLSRNVSNVESTMPEHCLGTVVLATLESDLATTPGSWLILRTDGTTTHATKTLTTSGSAQLITKVQ